MNTRASQTLVEQARPVEQAGDALLLERLRSNLFERTGGVTLGRYRLFERLGSGGMGVVYAAEDPQLNRRVAIKLLKHSRPGHDAARARARMLREAKAMAALSHPNVLPIFDVGTDRDDVFLAMELVDGVSLDVWLAQQQRSVDEILEVFTAAGAGLRAAHQAGLVHRDFKAANVMIDRRSHVYVMDFGLARMTVTDTLVESERGGMNPGDSVTQTGLANGSPAYMSPQQHRGEPPDPRSDEWSFAVALYEALYGRLPFQAATLKVLRAKIRLGIDDLPERTPPVPKRVEAVIRRALQPDPDARFGSMDELLAALGPPRRRTARWVSALGVTGAFGCLGLFASAPPQSCLPASGAEIWNPSRRSGLHDHFRRVGNPFVTAAWPRLEGRIDEYFDEWSLAYAESCHLPGPERTRTEVCLDIRLLSLHEVLTVLEQSDPIAAAKSVDMLGDLPKVRDCEPSVIEDGALHSPDAIPIVALLNRARTLHHAARHDDALRVLEEALPRARELTTRALEVRVLTVMGQAQAGAGDLEASQKTLEEAVWAAEAASLDVEGLEAALVAANNAVEAGALERAQHWITLAHSRLGASDDEGAFTCRLALAEGSLARAHNQWPQAEAFAAAAITAAAPASAKYRASAWVAMGIAHYHAQRWDEAERAYRQAIELLLPTTGPGHPTILKIQSNIAITVLETEDFVRARDILAATIPALREALGDSSLPLAAAYGNLALCHDGLGEDERSLSLQRQALAIRREILGAHPHVAMTVYNVALELTKQGRDEDAAVHFHESIEMLSATAGVDHPLLLGPLQGAARSALNTGRIEPARRWLERVRKLQDELAVEEANRMQSDFLFARLAWADGEHERAHRLAAEARADVLRYEDPSGAFATGLVAEIDAWLEAH